jgi:predicted GIY-YIG superfamily endonuclease
MLAIYYLEKKKEIFYVGYTKNIKNRITEHRRRFGIETEIHILEYVNTSDKKYWESYWIEQFKQWGFNLINKNSGGGGPLFQTLEAKEKYKNWRKDKKPMLGKKQSKETIKRKSDALKGKPKPEGFGDMMRKVRLGIPKPEGTGEKISKALTGIPSKKAKTVIQYDLEGNFIAQYSNTLLAASMTNSNSSTISKVCRGIFSQTNGYKWKYK